VALDKELDEQDCWCREEHG